MPEKQRLTMAKLSVFGLSCLFVLSLTTLVSAISPRFDARAYTVVSDSPVVRSQFHDWARSNQRSYASQEFGFRYNVWRDNVAFIEHFNANANASFTLGVNGFADMTEDEVSRIHKGFHASQAAGGMFQGTAIEVTDADIQKRQAPSSLDWRNSGAVTAIKNQGSCGACYTFSSSAAMEGMEKIATGRLTSLSEQMLLDCAQGTGNLGCSGGNMEVTYSWILNNGGGLNTEASYPWTGTRSTCRYNPANNGAYMKAYRRAAAGSEGGLLTLTTYGPVSVGVNASPRTFMYYRSGIISDPSCTASYIDHAVTVIGYGTASNGEEYWLIKNSWGTSWGESGFGMIAKNSGNMCGIASMASQPCYNAGCA